MKAFKETKEGKWEPSQKYARSNYDSKKSKKKIKGRWDDLHELSIIKKEAMKKIKADMITQEEMDLMKCTFQPKILTKSDNIKIDFLQRNENWLKEKRKKQTEIRKYKDEKKDFHCTFNPKLLKKNLDSKQDNVYLKTNVVPFIEKQKVARQMKNQKNIKNHYLDKHFKKNIVNNSELKKLQNLEFGATVLKLHQKFLAIEIAF